MGLTLVSKNYSNWVAQKTEAANKSKNKKMFDEKKQECLEFGTGMIKKLRPPLKFFHKSLTKWQLPFNK